MTWFSQSPFLIEAGHKIWVLSHPHPKQINISDTHKPKPLGVLDAGDLLPECRVLFQSIVNIKGTQELLMQQIGRIISIVKVICSKVAHCIRIHVSLGSATNLLLQPPGPDPVLKPVGVAIWRHRLLLTLMNPYPACGRLQACIEQCVGFRLPFASPLRNSLVKCLKQCERC